MRPGKLAAAPLAFLAMLGTAAAAPQTVTGAASRVTLLELYTSEGCSSCPPAEAWLSTLQNDPRLWKSLVPVSFHVDYWDYLGWHDPFDSGAYTARQAALAARAGSNVYTPGFMLDGREWRDWFTHQPLVLDAPTTPGRLELQSSGREVRALYRPPDLPAQPLQVHVALLAFGVDVPVGAGENEGRRLRHDFLVVSYARAPLSGAAGLFQGHLSLPPPVPVHATRYALAAWVTAENDPQPLQAAGGWLAAAP